MRQGKLTIKDKDGRIFDAVDLPGGITPDQHFIDCCLGKSPCEAAFECGLEVIRLTEATWESAEQNGAAVKVKF